MNATMRMDAAVARLSVRLMGAHGVRAEMKDFMPWPTVEPEPATPQEVLAFLTSKVKRKE